VKCCTRWSPESYRVYLAEFDAEDETGKLDTLFGKSLSREDYWGVGCNPNRVTQSGPEIYALYSSTANMTTRQRQVGFSYTFFVPQFKWITRTNNDIKTAADLRGKTVAVTAGTNTALFVKRTIRPNPLPVARQAVARLSSTAAFLHLSSARAWRSPAGSHFAGQTSRNNSWMIRLWAPRGRKKNASDWSLG
jgi:ABC-type amino acid transport substrate-binding protein